MDDEMNIQISTTDLSTTINQVVRLIDTLYNSKNTIDQNEANRRLTELQSSNKIWDICWPLLDPNQYQSQEINFFAANILVLKINQSWAQQDGEWLETQLRPKLFETLVKYASLPNAGKIVVERLSLALANFALYSIPTFWPDAIEDILQTFTPLNLPVSIPPQRICEILLKILTYIPEEYSVLVPQHDHRTKLNQQMTKSGPIVFKFLQSLLVADESSVDTNIKQNVLRTLTSWTVHSRTSLLEMDDNRTLLTLIYDSIVDDELCGLACSTIAATFSSQKAENYRNAIIDYIPKIADLHHVVDRYLREDEVENAIKIYSLVINFSENHSRLFLKIILKDDLELADGKFELIKQSLFTIIRTVLDCTSAPGVYGIDEKYSEISFPFWLSFFEHFCFYSDSYNDLICETFNPLVDSLLQILIRKAQYPPLAIYYHTWNDDQREAHRCYRQDLGDTISLIVQFPRSRDRILLLLCNQLEQELTILLHSDSPTIESSWQGFESIVFALKSIAESVPYDESEHMPKIFNILSKVPFTESHVLLYCSVAELISSYSDWLYSHNIQIAIAFNILFLGINSSDPHARLMSTLSLKDLTSECQTILQPFAQQIVRSCTEAVLQPISTLTTNEKSRLMHTIGTTLAASPSELITNSLSTLTTPLICDLKAKAQLDPTLDPTCRPIILERLTMLNNLIESLYIKPNSGNDYEGEGDENDYRALEVHNYDTLNEVDIIQPSLGLLKELVPILSLISAKYQTDEELMSIISSTIKRASKSLGIEVKPVMKDLLMIIVTAYDPSTNSSILESAQPLYMLFKTDTSLNDYLRDGFARMSDKTLEVCIGNHLQQLSLALENYFRFASFVCKRFPNFFSTHPSTINMEYIYKLAIASLELPEKRTLAEVCNYLIQFTHRSFDIVELNHIILGGFDMLISNIFNVMGGIYSTPRNALDQVYALLYVLLGHEESKGVLKTIVDRPNFPTNYVNSEQKVRFISRIVHERNQRKFKDICSEFVLTIRNLNRLV